MKKLNYFISALDGVVQFIGIKIVIIFTQTLYSIVSLKHIIAFSITIPLLTALVYFFILFNEHSSKNILLSSAYGLVAFVLFLIIDFVMILVLSNNSNSTDNYAMGILMIISLFVFIAASLIFKICALLVLIIRNKNKVNKQNTENGSNIDD